MLKPAEQAFWEEYASRLPRRPEAAYVEASYAGGPAVTDGLIALYLSGKKWAGSSMVREFTEAGDPVPKPGNYWICLDSAGRPALLLRTLSVEINPFRSVPERVAKAEGEGDLTVKSWQDLHRPGWPGLRDDEPIVTEYFELLQARKPSLEELSAGHSRLPSGPKDEGRMLRIVRRRAPGDHHFVDRVVLSRSRGLPGDRWWNDRPRKLGCQLTVMRHDVASLIARGQPLITFGDNLFVDLDLSAANLPPGSKLKVGGAVVEVAADPHNGCKKFQERFGADALKFVAKPETRHLNLRGVHWTVLSPGEVAAGARISVLSRP